MRSYYRVMITAITLSGSLLLQGCTSDTASAPVLNAWYQPAAKNSRYRVQKGDTLYSIAWVFGLDYHQLAKINHISPPYELRIGQQLTMTNRPASPNQHATLKPKALPQPNRASALSAPRIPRWHSSNRTLKWVWPTNGRIVSRFSPKANGNYGIDFTGYLGKPVKAAANGQVVYSGRGVRGYGNLIIIKHNDKLLSAYAFNRQVYVKVGEKVRVGQKIATMGRNTANKIRLHFEIRRNGKPINPLSLLKRQ